ncbi:glycosyltransferase family 2 protein [Ahrensia sp. R2A130]|uniref:glycosyltransferase family 2 protein n=1 Tax=Ahrensia sp. R2A130 TaxID=744979 RepID=UPI0001E08C3C|nr:glycosyltransferase family 2 protein [Ahrensia sp. R2A130]EFL89546.1 putative glycosyl transferase, group 2 [Ahrensia sp. R2A130]
MNPASLTVVVPHYGHTLVLARAVASALAQASDRCAIEVVIVDDGSEDDDLEIVRGIAANDSRVRLIEHGENRGVVAALNTGLAEVRTGFVSFLGADDCVLPGWANTLLQLLAQNENAAFASACVALIDQDGAVIGLRPYTPPPTGYLSPDDVVRELRRSDNWVLNTTAIYRLSVLINAGGFDPSLGSFCDAYLVRKLAVKHGFFFHNDLFGLWTSTEETYSAATSQSIEHGLRISKRAKTVLSQSDVETAFPGYATLHDRRLRFSLVRHHLKLQSNGVPADDLVRLGALTGLDRAVLRFLAISTKAQLAWIFLRLYPLPVVTLLRARRNSGVRLASARLQVARWFGLQS